MVKTIDILQDRRGIATLTIDRRGKLNSFDETQIDIFNDKLASLHSQDGLRALVLQGAGKVFCAGADLIYLRDKGSEPWEKNLSDAKKYAAMMTNLRELKVPVIAKVHGGAYGGGVGMVAASDIVISESTSRFAITEGKYGFTASIMMPYLLPRIGTRQARRWCLTSEEMSAKIAFSIGLVDLVVDVGCLDVALEKLLDGLLHNGPTSVTETKLAMNYLSYSIPNHTAVEKSVIAFAKGRAMKSAAEGVASFIEGRKPRWASAAIPLKEI